MPFRILLCPRVWMAEATAVEWRAVRVGLYVLGGRVPSADR
jgi:hypothetical protein